LAFEQRNAFLLNRLLRVQEPFGFIGLIDGQQAFAHFAPHLPRGRGDIQARRRREFTRLRDAITALACGLNRNVQGRRHHPRGGNAEVRIIGGHNAHRRIGAFPGRLLASISHRPARAGQFEIGAIIIGGQRQILKIPLADRPRFQIGPEIGFHENLEPWGIQSPLLKFNRRALRRDLLWMKPNAPCQSARNKRDQ